ncbi:hypothetical protein BX661DRAFT_178553 [Kickxella alabastrina]|uniref:uncharacterized protein n=1 Tax=Kickxella alabastrina TaxID=61397 RepID=UPI00221EAB89|nr:uncharacterized protein BX661DRAFT_178553 [Kickxella alabastrina]KAI7833520.1 hypothetical protein BX661DRAFT_178553 [Kickxella alabastrina]KAJ1939054.1 hypothetical protein GGF37_004556 [Kickxella alabastrina]
MTKIALTFAAIAAATVCAQQLPPGFSFDILTQLPVPPQQAPAPTQAPAPIDPNNPITQPAPLKPASAPQPASIPAGLEGLLAINSATLPPSISTIELGTPTSSALPTILVSSPLPKPSGTSGTSPHISRHSGSYSEELSDESDVGLDGASDGNRKSKVSSGAASFGISASAFAVVAIVGSLF